MTDVMEIPDRTIDTLVVGAGISGLAYAYERRKADPEVDCLVVDSATRVGGLVQTIQVEDPVAVRFEAGPETISDSSGVARRLSEELGLKRVIAAATKRFLVQDGLVTEIPLSPPKLLTSSLLPLSARLRMLTEPWREKGRALDGSLAEFVRHRLGESVLETLVDPMVGGIYASAPELLSLRACFPDIARGVAEHGTLFAFMRARRGRPSPRDRNPWKPEGGMQALPEALAARLEGSVALGLEVLALRAASGSRDWIARTRAGKIRARRVVLALPLHAMVRLLNQALPEAGRLFADQVAEGIVVVPHAYRREDVAHALDGFGYLVASKEGLGHLGTLFSSSLDPSSVPDGVVLLRTMLGGSRDAGVLELGDEAILDRIRREAGALLGISAKPLMARVVRHPCTLPRYDLEHPPRIARLAETLPENLTLLGNHQRGIGLSALLADAKQAAEKHGPLSVADRPASARCQLPVCPAP
jgi:oxygen-dependent protoporphyrinogen oxidase